MATTALSDLFKDHQGWFLTALSSLMCIIGASIIYLDLLVKFCKPSSTFDIKSNEKFLISGFSVSAGSLIFTSLFKLLPRAQSYFDDVEDPVSDKIIPELNVLVYFMIGIALCSVLNKFIHYFASESIIHCAHGDEESQTHSHSHSHSSDSGAEEFKHHGHSHGHESYLNDEYDQDMDHSSHHHLDEPIHTHEHPSYIDQNSHHSHENYDHDQSYSTEVTPLLATQEVSTIMHTSNGPEARTLRVNSFIFRFLRRFKPKHDCVCIEDINCNGLPCISSEEFQQKISNDISNLEFYRHLSRSASKNSIIAYTKPPNNLDTVTSSHDQQESYFPSQRVAPPNLRLATESDLNAHYSHKDDHHHRISSPISKLLSIGLQTCLALSLHKFPEGFITYATSTADPKMGISIFLSLALHNIIEGFSMTLPLYLALNSRLKAFMITFFLGGFSQPIGALFAFFVLRGRQIDSQDSDYVFGVLIAITSGFLLVISLQLFASAINFGGNTNNIIGWSVLGIFFIQISGVLTSYSS